MFLLEWVCQCVVITHSGPLSSLVLICRMASGVSAVWDSQKENQTNYMPTNVLRVTAAAPWKLFPIAIDAAHYFRQKTAAHSVLATEQVHTEGSTTCTPTTSLSVCPLSVCPGYLCGSCSNGTGVTALLDRCERCSPLHGLLIAALGERAGLTADTAHTTAGLLAVTLVTFTPTQ